ncbi:MAG TPA: helix-turn-helix transcriptional regulator [Pirellulales bacterium]
MDKQRHTPQQAVLQELLRELRRAADLSQEELARRLDEPQPFVSRYETGERRLDVLELRVVLSALGVSFVEFAQRFEDQIKAAESSR